MPADDKEDNGDVLKNVEYDYENEAGCWHFVGDNKICD